MKNPDFQMYMSYKSKSQEVDSIQLVHADKVRYNAV
jgi:hypothetical protein